MANGTMAAPAPYVQPTANDRLTRGFGNWFWGGIAAAALIHFAVMAFWPSMEAADVSINSEEIEQIEVVQEFEIPPPPEQIVRPAVPVMSMDEPANAIAGLEILLLRRAYRIARQRGA